MAENQLEGKLGGRLDIEIEIKSCDHQGKIERKKRMYEISVESSFSAAHRLKNYQGPCEKLHGHNWLVRAHVRCRELDAAGLGIDFRVLRTHLRNILSEFDHNDLNTVLDPLGLNPSSENIARYIFEKIEKELATWTGEVLKVEVYETPGSRATYYR